MRIFLSALFALLTALAAGCGTGGGTGGNTVDTAPQGRTATAEFITMAPPNLAVIYAVEFTVRLPSGVSVSADPRSGELLAGVLDSVDDSALASGRYLPATATEQAAVRVNISDPSGFPVGALAALHCLVASGTTPGAPAFSIEGFSARDADGAVIPEVWPHLTLRTQ